MAAPIGPRKGSERVRAWIYAAINPLLDALRFEKSLLDRGASTWRFFNQRFEYIHAPAHYLDGYAIEVLTDLERKYPGEVAPLGSHAALLETLRLATVTAHTSLTGHPSFAERVEATLETYLSSDGGEPWGAYGREKFPLLVAERVVNHAPDTLPDHYADAAYWARNGSEFLAFGTGAEFDALRAALVASARGAGELIERLLRLRTALCDEYDIAPVPFEPASA